MLSQEENTSLIEEGGPATASGTAPVAASMLAEEENYPEIGSLQEQLNENILRFYEKASEEDIRAYQRSVEDIKGERIAEQALQEPAMAPHFQLEDQDGNTVALQELLKKGPVVLTFYRGKWCPHCNLTLMTYQKHLVPLLDKYNATLVAISPMLPDGTVFLATKRDLEYHVCSDINNYLAKQFRVSFAIQPHTREFFVKYDHNLPDFNGLDADWEIPLPATYIIAPTGQIVWSFLDNDPGIRAEVEDIAQELANLQTATTENDPGKSPTRRQRRCRSRSPVRKMFNRTIARTFSGTFSVTARRKTPPTAARTVE